jgi:hypothetical protein
MPVVSASCTILEVEPTNDGPDVRELRLVVTAPDCTKRCSTTVTFLAWPRARPRLPSRPGDPPGDGPRHARPRRSRSGGGLTPTHLYWHCLADGGRDDILDLTLALAKEYALAVRIWLEPRRRKLRQRGLPVRSRIPGQLQSRHRRQAGPGTQSCCATCRLASASGQCTPAWATRSRRL